MMRRMNRGPQTILLASVVAASGLGVAIHSAYVVWRSVSLEVVVPFALALVLVNLLAVRLPRGDVLVLDGAIVVGAMLVYGGAVAVLASFIGGLVGSVWVRGSSGTRLANALDLSRRILVVWAVELAGVILIPVGAEVADLRSLLLAMLIGLMYMSLDLGTYSVGQSLLEHTQVLECARSVARSVFFLYVGQVCLGIALAIVHSDMGVLGVAVLGVVAMILLNAFNMYLRTKIMYQQTIDALSRAASMQLTGPHPDSRLVADLCVAVGRRLGMHGRALERLSYAALLCDVGLLGCSESQPTSEEHAESGAALVQSVPFLADAAEMIRYHHTPFRDLEALDVVDARGAAVIHLCSDFILCASRGDHLGSHEARISCLNQLIAHGGVEYGEQFLSALSRELHDTHALRRYDWGAVRAC